MRDLRKDFIKYLGLTLLTLLFLSCSNDNPIESLGDPTTFPKLSLPVPHSVYYVSSFSPSPTHPKGLRVNMSSTPFLQVPARGVVTKVNTDYTGVVTVRVFHNAHISSEMVGAFSTTLRVGDVLKDGDSLGTGTILGSFDFFVYYDSELYCYYSFLSDEARTFVNFNSWIITAPCL